MTLAGCRVGSCGRGRPCVAIRSNESWRRPGCGGPLRPAAIYAGPTVGSPQRGRGAKIPSNRAVVSVPSPQRGADYATAVGWRTQNNGYEYSAPRGCISHLGHAGQDHPVKASRVRGVRPDSPGPRYHQVASWGLAPNEQLRPIPGNRASPRCTNTSAMNRSTTLYNVVERIMA